MQRLLADGRETYAILRQSSDSSRLPRDLLSKANLHVCRYSSYEMIQDILADVSAKHEHIVVYHLAACVSSGETTSSEITRLLESNLLYGTVLAEAAAQVGVDGFVNTGTYWQYYHGEGYSPVNLYAATKQAYMDILRYYEDAYGLPVITLSLYDTYGLAIGKVHRQKILDYLHDHAAESRVVAMSPGEQRMNYVYIDDIIEAYIQAGNLLAGGRRDMCGTYAVRAEQDVSLRQVIDTYLQMLRARLQIAWGKRAYRAREVMQPDYHLPILPGWHPRIGLREGLQRMAH